MDRRAPVIEHQRAADRRPVRRASPEPRQEAGRPGSGLSDEALLAGMAQGDHDAAVVLVRRYQKRAFGLAMSLLGDVSRAEDVAQEALIRVWRHAAVFDARRGKVSTWILTITRNLAVDSLRLRRAQPTDPDDLVGVGLLSSERSPEDEAVTSDDMSAVRRALTTLPAEQRRALVLAAMYGRTALEISEAESIPLGTAKTRVRAGLAKVRATLAASLEGDEEP